jgi:hypothetical protein
LFKLFTDYQKRIAFLFFIVLILLAIIFRYWNHSYLNIISSDGKGYYAYLPAIFIYHDLDYNYFFNGELNIEKDYTSSFLFFIEGNDVIKYPAGVALTLLPFFLIAILFSIITGCSVDGYSFWFQIFASIGAITYTCLGALWIMKTLKIHGFNNTTQLIIVFSLVFGTNLTNYTIWDPTMSHAASFSIVALFIFKVSQFSSRLHKYDVIWIAMALAIIILIRPVNGLIILAVPAFIVNIKIFKEHLYYTIKNAGIIISSILIFLLIIFIQPLLWYLQNGMWVIWTYLGETFDFSKPQWQKILFSYRKGWLLYTPVMMFIIPGLFLIFLRKKHLAALSILIFSLTITFVLSSWWCWYYGGSFGQRSFIDFYAVFALPLAFITHAISLKKYKYFFILLAIGLISVNLIQSYQYKNNIIHYDSMTKEGYWKVFLKTNSKYKWSLFHNDRDVPDADIKDKIIARFFQDFEFEKPNWWYRKADDIADESLSGNKVIALHTQPEPVKFTFSVDSSLLTSNLSLRFSIWYIGEKDKLQFRYFIENAPGTKTLADFQLAGFKKDSTFGKWQRIKIDLPVDSKITESSKIVLELKGSEKNQLYLDDAMISIYKLY